LILVITGTTIRAEQMDRPLAYYLQSELEVLAEGDEDRFGLVVSDARYLNDEDLQDVPVISVGGPGVNVLAQRWLDDMPVVMHVEQKFFIQADWNATPPRASIWGMNNPLTKVAVITFAEKFLKRFATACWEQRAARAES
jgi:hypothetical protein